MGQIFSHSNQDHDSSLKRSPSNSASSALLKQTISQNMRLSKSKVSSLLKANHMNHSIVHRNHFYNTLPHVCPWIPFPCPLPNASCLDFVPLLCGIYRTLFCDVGGVDPSFLAGCVLPLMTAHWSGLLIWSHATKIIRYLRRGIQVLRTVD